MIEDIGGHIRWMEGTGNRFAIIDEPDLGSFKDSELAQLVGEWVDGLLVLCGGDHRADLVMRVINSDGSSAAMCGNGLRCVAFDLHRRGRMLGRTVRIRVGSHIAAARCRPFSDNEAIVHVRMPLPTVSSNLDHMLVNLGNEHAIFIKDSLPDDIAWAECVKSMHARGLSGLNLHVVHVLNQGHVEMKSWERGAGPTSACASGATAVVSAIASCQTISSIVKVSQPGGALMVKWRGLDSEPVNIGKVGVLRPPAMVVMQRDE